MSPTKPIIHQVAVFRKGVRQEISHKTTTTKFSIRNTVLVTRLKMLLAMS